MTHHLRTRLGAVLLLCLLLSHFNAGSTPAQATSSRPFSDSSPFNVPIRSNPAIDSSSQAMIAYAARDKALYANLHEFGVPIFTATSTTPEHQVWCSMSWAWGPCPLAARKVRIPDQAVPSPGSDGAMAVIDSTRNTVDEYWQARRVDRSWAATWGAINSLSGSGWGGGSTGAGASRLAGVVRVSEIRAGVINHALVLQSDNVCRGVFRAPALKTDGLSTRSDCIPEGARLQLDPNLSLASLPGLTAGERAVARAMQVYGAYLIDRSGAPLSVSFEVAPDASWSTPGAVYTQAGLSWDYYAMPHVPWQKLRVLKTWT